MKYFNNCTTAEELKKAYHDQARRLHPDCGGDPEAFKKMAAEFESMWERLKDTHKGMSGDIYTKNGEQATAETAGEFMEIINVLVHLSGLDVEMCGSWVWVGGDTKAHKDTLKEIGCRWSANKKMWYYHKEEGRRFHKKAWSIDRIRATYGSTTYKPGNDPDRLPEK